jgi:hypothetical protein
MIQIKPISVGFPNITPATQILIRPIINSTTDTSCNTYWELFNSDGKQLANGNEPINEEEYALWGGDNSDLENIVLKKLNLERNNK